MAEAKKIARVKQAVTVKCKQMVESGQRFCASILSEFDGDLDILFSGWIDGDDYDFKVSNVEIKESDSKQKKIILLSSHDEYIDD